MAKIVRAVAFANNEIAFAAWEIDQLAIPGCLGFHIVREYLDANDKVVDEKPLASYVAFKGQRNPDWLPQNTTVCPVQKFSWRDLTLRKRRDAATRRRSDDRVRYRIRAVGRLADGMEPVELVQEMHKDKTTGALVDNGYAGRHLALGYLTAPAWTNAVDVTSQRPPFFSTFTNGILSTQFLLRVLEEDGKIEKGELEAHLRKPGDWLRNYLAGDVIPTLRDFFAQPKGRFHAALYELEDEELVKLLSDNSARLDLILSDAGSEASDDDGDGKNSTAYDTRNAPARKLLRKLANKKPTTFSMQDRLFNGTGHIGHNKFVVYVDDAGVARSVLTGSTNWTWSGVAGQSNNCIRIDDDEVAAAYLAYWEKLHEDEQPKPKPLSARNTGAGQGDALKEADQTQTVVDLGHGASIEVWFSPNVPGKNQPPSPKAKTTPPPPPDMERLFSLMRKAQRSIFFLVFMPSRGGINSIVSEAVALGQKDSSLDVIGAISDTQAMWGYKAGSTDEAGKKTPATSPHVFEQGGVSVVRATALTDKEIGKPLGDFQFDEKLTVGRAIIHDKILVLDPTDPVNCTVAFGSHNMGYKASYSNDENLVIVRGHRPLALAYAAHVLDVFDHYRFRAVEAEVSKKKKGGSAASGQFDGFLDTSDDWQERASRRLSRYFTETSL
jgi:phosphatidylserine/phosphatidylglycerophosphate/cardiolipin synthase-like enzyme